jgi:hypothetical protein
MLFGASGTESTKGGEMRWLMLLTLCAACGSKGSDDDDDDDSGSAGLPAWFGGTDSSDPRGDSGWWADTGARSTSTFDTSTSTSTSTSWTGSGAHPCGEPDGTPELPTGEGVDITPPVLSCVGFTESSYAIDESGYLEFRVTDDVSGFDKSLSSCWEFESRSGKSDFYTCEDAEHLGGDLYRMPFTVYGDFIEDGDYLLAYVYINDVAGNYNYARAEWGDDLFDDEDFRIQVPTMTVLR